MKRENIMPGYETNKKEYPHIFYEGEEYILLDRRYPRARDNADEAMSADAIKVSDPLKYLVRDYLSTGDEEVPCKKGYVIDFWHYQNPKDMKVMEVSEWSDDDDPEGYLMLNDDPIDFGNSFF